MSEVDEQIQRLKARASAAEKARLMAEHRAAVAQEKVKEAKALLHQRYGVETREEAIELLATLDAQVKEKISEVEKLLEGAESTP